MDYAKEAALGHFVLSGQPLFSSVIFQLRSNYYKRPFSNVHSGQHSLRFTANFYIDQAQKIKARLYLSIDDWF